MTPSSGLGTASSLLDVVKELEPLLRAHAADGERERRLPDPVADAMREHGLYRMWRPKALGGLEIDPATACRVIEEVSRIDSAAGWNLQLSCGVDPFGAWFSDEGAHDIFSHPGTILAGAFFPPRRAAPVDGGYRVTGQTPFVSGVQQATWIFGLANIFAADDGPQMQNGQPVTLITACRARDTTVVNTWYTLGMRGTGSHDVRMTDIFVPTRHTAVLAPLERPGSAYTGPLYRFTIWAAIAGLAPVALGIARAAIDQLLKLATRKTPAYSPRALSDRASVQSAIGEAEALLGAARAYLYEALEDVWSHAVEGRVIDMRQKIKVQLAATNAPVAAARAVDIVHAAAGSSGIRDEQPFQRHFRDVHTITQHGFISASRYESVGQVLLGAPVEWPFFGL